MSLYEHEKWFLIVMGGLLGLLAIFSPKTLVWIFTFSKKKKKERKPKKGAQPETDAQRDAQRNAWLQAGIENGWLRP